MSDWRAFFDVHAPRYMDEPFTVGTVAEVDFAERELGLAPGSHVLDVGCGTGRHSVELARRGFRVTGLDLSPGMLEQAEAAARAAGVEVRWVEADATDFTLDEPADAALCVCEGAFSLLGGGDDARTHDEAVLACIHDALRAGGPLLLTALSVFRVARASTTEDVTAGRFDPLTSVETETLEYGEAGDRRFTGRERLYTPVELARLVADAGFTVEHVGGGTAGMWARRPLDLDEYEIMLIARRGADERRARPSPAQDRAAATATDGGRRGGPGAAAAPRDVRVRRATPGDAAGVARVLNEAIGDGRFTILDRTFTVEEESAYISGLGPRGFVHVAETSGGEIVGVQTVAPLDDDVRSQDHVATMGTWVPAQWRRRGVGRALFAASAAAARELGYAKVFTDVRADNEASLAFHESLGFSVVGRARRHVRIGGRYLDALLIEAEL